MFEGIRKFQTDHKLEVDGVMKPEGETETTFNKMLRKGEYMSTAAQQGLSLGWADEAEGVIGGSVYALGNKLTGRGSMKEGYDQGYQKYRDERRGVLEEGYRKEPILTGMSEMVGAVGNRINFVKAAPTAPMRVIARKNLLDAITSGSVYGIGASKNEAEDYAKNVGLGMIGNALGNKVSNKIVGRSGTPMFRSLVNEISGKSAEHTYDRLRRKFFEKE